MKKTLILWKIVGVFLIGGNVVHGTQMTGPVIFNNFFNQSLCRVFETLPLNFRWALQSLRDDADDVHVKEVLRFLRDFLGKVPRYKYFAIDRDFFDMAKFIIRTHRLEANTKIRELIEAIDLEFQSVEDFIVSNPSYPFFFSVAPWHDVPFKQGIEENDIDKLKDAWKSCLELDPYHNVFFDEPMENSELWELWGKYREEAKKKDLWDDELDEIFCSLQEALFGEDKSRVYWF